MRSERVYGILYQALPEQLRNQADTAAERGFAYGLWHWLETELQSTSDDAVEALLLTWQTMRQDDTESFNAWRAREGPIAPHARSSTAREKRVEGYAARALPPLAGASPWRIGTSVSIATPLIVHY